MVKKKQSECGRKPTPEYVIWNGMRGRCNTPTNGGYRYYGARDIKVCDRWNSYAAFLEDMGRRPSPKHSLNRIDNDGHYCPENCEWTDDETQQNNKRNNRYITHDGMTKTVAQWCRFLGLPPRLVWYRLDAGWSELDALTKKKRFRTNPHKKLSINE